GFTLKSNKNTPKDEYVHKRSLEIGTYVGSSAGAMLSIFLASGFTPQEVINGVLGLSPTKMKKLSYKDIFYFKQRLPKMMKNNLYHPLDGLPPFFKQMLKPFMGFSG